MFMMLFEGFGWVVVIGLAILALAFASAGLAILLGYILSGLRRTFGPSPQAKPKA
jgi:hypothetical protein